MILNNLFSPLSGLLLLLFLKSERQHPRRVPRFAGIGDCDLLLQSSFVRDHICVLPGASHSVRMCSIVSSVSQRVHMPLSLGAEGVLPGE